MPYLILQNGCVFSGSRFGAFGDVTGELVFTTAMTGYLETITDPSFYGQIVLQTFPLIGNYGVIPSDFESKSPKLFAYIVREWCQDPSNFRSEGDLDTFLRSKGVVGFCGVDTRRLTKLIREQGVMNAAIVDELPEDMDAFLDALHSYRVKDAVETATIKRTLYYLNKDAKKKVVLWDFGAKENIARMLFARGFEVIRVPASATAKEIMSCNADGVMLSNGPGDPADNPGIIEEIKKLMEHDVPMFGICLGHQLLAIANGANTVKMKYGHRGANQPVKDLKTGRLYMTSQNHGYAVDETSLPTGVTMSFANANDGTCEGLDYEGVRVFSVQFHPEAAAGPCDTGFLFDRFVNMMEGF